MNQPPSADVHTLNPLPLPCPAELLLERRALARHLSTPTPYGAFGHDALIGSHAEARLHVVPQSVHFSDLPDRVDCGVVDCRPNGAARILLFGVLAEAVLVIGFFVARFAHWVR